MQNLHRSPLYSEAYKPAFSGHETFPLRYGWLKKAYDALEGAEDDANSRELFSDDAAIGRFGLGKNMVASMRHWAICVGVIADVGRGNTKATELGHLLLGQRGLDPYFEHPGTLWLMHWQIASYDPEQVRPNKTSWQWLFNHFPGLAFDKDEIMAGLHRLVESRGWAKPSNSTLNNDVDCLLRTYVSRHGDKETVEDVLSSPLAELGLISGHHRRFQLVRGAKPSLPNGVFVYALEQYWRRMGQSRTLSFEALAHEPGSPGRVFLLDEVDLTARVAALEDVTSGTFKWSETAGLKQVIRQRDLSPTETKKLLRVALKASSAREAA